MAFWSERVLIEERLARLKSEAEKARLELEGLGRIEEKEDQLRRQDRDLDQLGSELNRVLADLRGSYKVAGAGPGRGGTLHKEGHGPGSGRTLPHLRAAVRGPARSAHKKI